MTRSCYQLINKVVKNSIVPAPTTQHTAHSLMCQTYLFPVTDRWCQPPVIGAWGQFSPQYSLNAKINGCYLTVHENPATSLVSWNPMHIRSNTFGIWVRCSVWHWPNPTNKNPCFNQHQCVFKTSGNFFGETSLWRDKAKNLAVENNQIDLSKSSWTHSNILENKNIILSLLQFSSL